MCVCVYTIHRRVKSQFVVINFWKKILKLLKKKKEKKKFVRFQTNLFGEYLVSTTSLPSFPIFFNFIASYLHRRDSLRSHFLPVLFISPKYTAATRSNIFWVSSRYRAHQLAMHALLRKGQWIIEQIYFIRATIRYLFALTLQNARKI